MQVLVFALVSAEHYERLPSHLNIVHFPQVGKTPLYVASHASHLEVVRELLSAGARVDRITNDGWTPLFAAIQAGKTSAVCIAQLLLDRPEIAVDWMSDSGRTPLHIACASSEGPSNTQLIHLLLRHRADIDKQDDVS